MVVDDLAEAAGMSVDYRPILLGGVFRSIQGPDVPAAEMAPARAQINMRDITRQAEMLGVPLTFPMAHPRRTVNAMRLILGAPKDKEKAMMKRLFRAYWVEGLDVSKHSVLEELAIEIGVSPDAMTTPEVKEALYATTAEAVELGVFGVPALAFGNRFWWGVDRFHMVAKAIGIERPVFPKPNTPLEPGGKIVFFHDFSSPFSYLASTQIERLAAQYGAEVEWVPILLGALFREIGTANAPILAMNAAKARYYARDMQDWSEWWGVPFQMSPHFPLRTVAPLRLALIEPRVTPILYRAAWAEGKNIGDPAVLSELLEANGFSAQEMLSGTQRPEIKAQLRENTARAVSLGCCGVPSFWVNDRVLVWGQDRFSQVEWALHGWRPAGE